ncbi:PREDICTED: uncharacterized protein LOC101292456 [Fragaria vesca subsp. vesca]
MGLSWLFTEVVPDLGMIEEDREQGDYDDMGLSLLFTEVVPEFAYGHLPPRVFRRRVVFKIKKREARLPLTCFAFPDEDDEEESPGSPDEFGLCLLFGEGQ